MIANSRVDDSGAELQRILEAQQLTILFQPIADVRTASILGYEALMRGPQNSRLASPMDLLGAAKQCGMTAALETLSCRLAIERFTQQQLAGKLFVNLGGPTLTAPDVDMPSALVDMATRAGLSPMRLMVELTEHDRIEDMARMEAVRQRLGTLGIGLALDDFGEGRSNLRLWAQLDPDIVKLDKFFVGNVYAERRKVEALRAMVRLAEAYETPLVVEGVEHARDLAILRDLGCQYAQGYLLGRPNATPDKHLGEHARGILESRKIAVMPASTHRTDRSVTAASLTLSIPTVTAADCCEQVARIFTDNPDAHAIAVLESGKPVGLINRRRFADRYGQPFHRELFGRRSCTMFMHPGALTVDQHTPIDALVEVLLGEDQHYLQDGFVITDGEQYLGLATGESLVRAVTERRVEAARHANPLTFLPGNIPITEHIRRLLNAKTPFSAAYFDLNDFKPFNDLYGYWRGDEMIKLVASVIATHSEPQHDFVGHVGGDDFVALFQSDDWLRRCENIVREFNTKARALFDQEQLDIGGIEGEDRRGLRTFFPLTTISVGVVAIQGGAPITPESVASAAASAKKQAKGQRNGLYVGNPMEFGKDRGNFYAVRPAPDYPDERRVRWFKYQETEKKRRIGASTSRLLGADGAMVPG